MLARLQQLTTIALLSTALGWAVLMLLSGHGWWAVAGVLVILLGYALVLGLECGLMSLTNRRDSLPPARLYEVLLAWWGELCSSPLIFCWQQPFRATAIPDRLTGKPGQRGLVLVHGFVCNRGLWNRWMARLAEHGVPFVAINLEPVFGEIDAYPAAIDAAVRALQESTGLAPVIVAHSMGGLAVRAWLRVAGGAAAMGRVQRVVTLGTPHRGTALARLGFSTNSRQMGLDSPWLAPLSAGESPQVLGRFICFYSNCDNIVFPTSAATLPHADNRALTACAHVHMVHHPVVFAAVLRELGVPPESPQAAPQ